MSREQRAESIAHSAERMEHGAESIVQGENY